MKVKRLPYLSRAERRALLLLEWVLMLAALGGMVYSWTRPDSDTAGNDTPAQQHARHATRSKGTRSKALTYATQEAPVETFPFDPNTADSTQLLRLGLAPWQVRAIYRYRAKHGRYHSPEDFARLPGMTGEMWQRLAPQIRIAERFRYVDAEAIAAAARPQCTPAGTHQATARDTQAVTGAHHAAPAASATAATERDTMLYPEKYRERVLVDLNTADTMQLKKIPGIASYRAAQIVRYRESLGGYVSVEQVMESCTLPDDVLDWLTLTHTHTRKVNLNQASVQAMRRHPYLTFYQARAIVERRRAKGNLHSASELLQLKEFTQQDIDRLQPYIEF